MPLLARTGSVYGSVLPIGRAAGGGSWENDGTTWSSLMTVDSGSFDIATSKGFSPPWESHNLDSQSRFSGKTSPLGRISKM